MAKVMSLQFGGIQVKVEKDGSGDISSDLHEGDELYDHTIDGIESLILSLALQGYDVRAPKFVQAVKDAVEGCANNV